jgi:hypothetical protein
VQINNPEHDNADQILLRLLFAEASARLLQVDSFTDAESEIASFPKCVQEHPEQRPFVVGLFTSALLDRCGAWEVVQFCLHTLRWPEMREFIEAQWTKQSNEIGSRTSQIWEQLIEAFDDDWQDLEFFKRK